MKILLTVPHAFCTTSLISEHYCDPIAEEIAYDLYDELSTSRMNKVILKVGKTPRPECDLNRIQCRNTNFRKRIRNHFKSGLIDLVLDIHSYPSDSEYGPYEITIIDDIMINRNSISYSLYKFLSNREINVGLIQGQDNDIIDEAAENRINSILIEFNESKSINDNIYFVKLISEWIQLI